MSFKKGDLVEIYPKHPRFESDKRFGLILEGPKRTDTHSMNEYYLALIGTEKRVILIYGSFLNNDDLFYLGDTFTDAEMFNRHIVLHMFKETCLYFKLYKAF